MATGGGPKNITKGLVAGMDTGFPESATSTSPLKYFSGQPMDNKLTASSTTLYRYNNPGFSGTNTNTGRVHPKHNTPIWKLTHAADSSNTSRLSSTEGFGCYHDMGTSLLPTAYYGASISFKPDPNVGIVTGSFNHGYSNIGGWNQLGTTRTIIPEGDGWYRMHTIFKNSTTAYSADGSTYLSTRYAGNTFTSFELSAGNNQVISHVVDTAQYLGGDQYYRGTYDFVASMSNNGGIAGATMTDWGINSDMAKPTFNPVYNYPTSSASDINVTIYMKVNLPSAGTIQMRTIAYSVATRLTDSKYWKIYFDSSTVSADKPMATYWSAPFVGLLSSITTVPNGTRGVRYLDYGNDRTISNNFKNLFNHSESGIGTYGVNSRSVSYDSNKIPIFDGTGDYMDIQTPSDYTTSSRNFTFICWVRSDGTLSVTRRGIFSASGMSQGYVSFFGYTGGTGSLLFETKDSVQNTYKGVGISVNNLYDGTWKMVGFQIKANSIDTFYFDTNGSYNASTSAENGLRGGFDIQNFRIGHDTSAFYWNGYIDGVRFYEKVLTQEEIELYYNSTKKRFV